ncbi:peptidase S41 [Desulfuromonas acetoxidans DSM 684]|uniref:Peptidase S41 n=2 Tax=Desulfuromonas acetoxidans TaxID=891 RepID=Q1K2Q6_DESA6|nr:peptidase S41 [Desulfuromonas acetoxidans DSM 684]
MIAKYVFGNNSAMIKKQFIDYLVLIAITVLISACGTSENNNSYSDEGTSEIEVGDIQTLSYEPASCSESDQRDFINKVMHDVYLWSEYTPDVDVDSYASQRELLDALVYNDEQWSGITTLEEYDSYMVGEAVAIGINFTDQDDMIYLTHVYPDSPAEDAGLQRGYALTSINGYPVADIINNDLWDEALGPDVLDLDYIDNDSNAGSVSITKTTFTESSVAAYSILTNSTNGNKVGYLNYLTFNDNYSTDLAEAYTAFAVNDIREIVVDLRYNGGGRVYVAQILGGIIGGTTVAGRPAYSELYNDHYSSWSTQYSFASENTLNIEKVVFIVTESTMSASELMINMLKPYMDITLIGSTTAGKPVGSFAIEYCGNYIKPIAFKLVNANMEGDYYDGFPVTCSATDDVTHPLGDREEGMLSVAMTYLETGSCPAE